MKFSVLVVLFVIFNLNGSMGDYVSDFCSKGGSGNFCNHDFTGYFWCFSDDWSPLSTFQECPDGTYCGCFNGPDCSDVPTIGSGSPCVSLPTSDLPYYPEFYTVTKDTTTTVSFPGGSYIRETDEIDYYDGTISQFRTDRNVTISFEGVTRYYQDFYNSSSHEHVANGECSVDLAPIPIQGIPRYPQTQKQYQFLRSDVYKGMDVDVYFFMKGGRIAGLPSVYAELWVTEVDDQNTVIPVYEIYNTIGANYGSTSEFSVTVYSDWNSAQPDESIWNTPSACNYMV